MNVFDIIGPIMVGPSSSHTAGAVGIGRVARALLAEEPINALISLHGSFAKTHRGHGTDRAIISGIMGMEMDDIRIPKSFDIAREKGLKYRFKFVDLGDVHPNTAFVELEGESGKRVNLLASSIGGGRISIQRINGMEVDFRGTGNILVVFHIDMPGAIASVTSILGSYNINIGEMKVFRSKRGGKAIMVIDVDEWPKYDVIESIKMLENIEEVEMIPPLMGRGFD
ncbi:MAG: L-serine ammonia-lyase, iron-sulfur-dependent, subunit beta [Clostridiales bacterium]|nr:L-serine ammonia-lyase, iron-sulfur-dependent, subunit beta [Clostridiales bacterium]